MNMANVWTIWREMGSAFVSKAGREGIALSVSIKVNLFFVGVFLTFMHLMSIFLDFSGS